MKFVPESLTRAVGTQMLKAQANSPTLLFAGGVVGILGTVVLASKATLHLEEVLEETNGKLADVKTLAHSDRYSSKDAQHDKAILYTDAVVKIAKLYGPAVVLGVVSIGCLSQSHRILTRRNVALTAAYGTLEKSFDRYRARVVADLGEDRDREFMYGTQTIEYVDENGKKSKKKVLGDGEASAAYSVIYDQLNPNWQGIPDLDRVFLDTQARYANQRLRAKGFLFLNDVYEALGFPRTEAGQIVGWWWDGEGDNFVDFGHGNWPTTHDYIHARDFGVVLDFNVDGPIHKRLGH